MVWCRFVFLAFIILTVYQVHSYKAVNCECGLLGNSNRIVNGWISEAHRFPWLVAIFYKKKLFCGGSIINSQFILTAGHCVRWSIKEEMMVQVGAHDITNRLQSDTYYIDQTFLHPNFYSFELYDINDIALMKVDRPIPFTKIVHPVCLPMTADKFENRYATVAGWGKLGNNENLSPFLRETFVKVLTQNMCLHSKMGKYMSPTVMCAFRNNTDSCQGDSGGPLILETEPGKATQIGVVSWGIGCASDKPGIYTRVSSYVPWIYKTANDGIFCRI